MSSKDTTTMLVRLGRAAYWGGCVAGLFCFVEAGVIFMFYHRASSNDYLSGIPIIVIGSRIIFGIIFILFGRAARYVLSEE